jgi:hypothetical protein
MVAAGFGLRRFENAAFESPWGKGDFRRIFKVSKSEEIIGKRHNNDPKSPE